MDQFARLNQCIRGGNSSDEATSGSWQSSGVLFVGIFVASAAAGPIPGAIFTTLSDGTRVNANIYDYEDDVYLDGGPGPQAPVGRCGASGPG